MRNRHRTPSTFSLWMVDVLCCSLGCVILLWLVTAKKAAVSSEASDEKGKALKEKDRENLSLQDALKNLKTLLARSQEEEAALRRLIKDADLREKLTEAERQKLAKELLGKDELAALLKKQLAEKNTSLESLQALIDSLKNDVKSKTTQGEIKQK